MPPAFASLERRVRLFDRLFRWGLEWLPGTAIGRPVLRDAILMYEGADHEGRRALRKLFGDCPAFCDNVALSEPPDSAEHVRRQLLHYSLIYTAGDTRDSSLWLEAICRDAQAAGVTIAPLLYEVAGLSSDDTEATCSAKQELLAAAGYFT